MNRAVGPSGCSTFREWHGKPYGYGKHYGIVVVMPVTPELPGAPVVYGNLVGVARKV
jgi:hypothetical protein